MAKKQRIQPESDDDLRDVVGKLHEATMSIELHGDGEHPSTVQDLSRISTAYIAARSELRQSAKSALRSLDSYQVDQILEHLRTRLRSDELEDAAKRLTGADAEEGLL